MLRTRRLQQPPIVLAAAVFGLLTGIVISLLPGHTGSMLIGFGLLLCLATIEPVSALMLLLVTAPLKALILSEAPIIIPLEIGQAGLILLMISILIRHAVERRPLQIALSPVHVGLGLFIAAAMLSLPVAASFTSSIGEIIKWLEMALLVTICLLLFQAERASLLVFALTLPALVQAVTGIYQFFGGSGAEHLRILDGTHFRAFGTFGQPNPYAAFLGLTLPLVMATAAGYFSNSLRIMRKHAFAAGLLRNGTFWSVTLMGIFYSGAAALLLGALLVSWSRGAWMGIAAASAVVLFLLPRTALQRAGILLAALAFAGIALTQGLIPASIADRMIGFVSELTSVTDVRGVYVTDENYAVTERIAHWQVAELIARDHPWIGAGFDNYEAAYPDYALLEWRNPLGHAHNYYLNLLAEIGIIGLSAYLILWGGVIGVTLRIWLAASGLARFWAAGLLGTWTYLAIHSLVDKLYVNNMFIQLGCLLGLLAILIRQQEASTE